MKTFAIEGLMGVGKSTIIKKMQAILNKIRLNSVYLPLVSDVARFRNIEASSSTEDGPFSEPESLLQMYYRDPNTWAFTFQLWALQIKLEEQEEEWDNSADFKFIEHSLFSSRLVFARALEVQGKITPLEMEDVDRYYKRYADRIDILPDGVIFLQASPALALQRVENRNRPEEAGRVTEEYLTLLNEGYKPLLDFYASKNVPVWTIDVAGLTKHEVVIRSLAIVLDYQRYEGGLPIGYCCPPDPLPSIVQKLTEKRSSPAAGVKVEDGKPTRRKVGFTADQHQVYMGFPCESCASFWSGHCVECDYVEKLKVPIQRVIGYVKQIARIHRAEPWLSHQEIADAWEHEEN